MIESATSTYLGRFALHAAAVLAASLVGAQFTQLSDTWSNPEIEGAVFAAALSMGPAVVVVSTAGFGVRTLIIVAGLAALGMLTMWWLYASSTSSTSALVFLMGWWVGLPAAAVLAIVDAVRPSGRTDFNPPTPS